MARIVKSPKAETDLENIWLCSFERWNEEQADRYYDELIRGIERLSDNPMLGKSREQIRKGYRSIQINRHVVYYRLQDNIIDIVRVLHQRMMPEKYI
ncbi:MAG: type II toxin-antitoxin system RelE/ParE family toxin [Rhodospirillales bacterium]|nr:type II toxin-antitoxin system RelE/ParE family toxin [Rhodospirillales bacterium]